ncbi:NAD-dependent epimerase/dehydratase family protein [Streptomyces sp. NPDC014846]|uniref:NAD-dependent epimerase/dehydratase family protein n=1 Tax=Streptomyces sp. NPDC014846 TaxID=3364922 RepID=UPI0036F69B8E
MRVFVAGGSGVLGRRLVPRLRASGRQVTATTTSTAKLAQLAQLGADGVVMDGLDAASVGEAVAKARPDVIVHQMTAISLTHAGKPDIKHPDRWFATTNRLRTEGTDHLLAAAEAAGVSHVVAQGYASWNGIREGGWVKAEEDPLDQLEGTAAASRSAHHAHHPLRPYGRGVGGRSTSITREGHQRPDGRFPAVDDRGVSHRFHERSCRASHHRPRPRSRGQRAGPGGPAAPARRRERRHRAGARGGIHPG